MKGEGEARFAAKEEAARLKEGISAAEEAARLKTKEEGMVLD